MSDDKQRRLADIVGNEHWPLYASAPGVYGCHCGYTPGDGDDCCPTDAVTAHIAEIAISRQ